MCTKDLLHLKELSLFSRKCKRWRSRFMTVFFQPPRREPWAPKITLEETGRRISHLTTPDNYSKWCRPPDSPYCIWQLLLSVRCVSERKSSSCRWRRGRHWNQQPHLVLLGELPMCLCRQVHCSVNLQEGFQSNASWGNSRRSRHRCIGFHPKSLVLGAPWRSLQGENDTGVPPSPVPADYRMGALAQSPSCTNRKTRTSTSCQQQHTGSRRWQDLPQEHCRSQFQVSSITQSQFNWWTKVCPFFQFFEHWKTCDFSLEHPQYVCTLR
jgi:hypothetical protein